MLRLTEIRLPLDHSEEELRAAVLQELGIEPQDLAGDSIVRRSFDARETAREGEILRRLRGNPHVVPTPDTSYHFAIRAPQELAARPVVIGIGPCGLFAGLLLAQWGFRPLILERGKEVRERTVVNKPHIGTFRLVKVVESLRAKIESLGGEIRFRSRVAAASEPGGVVTNGMSQYSRDERNANSGIVVGITPEDYPGGPLAGLDYQRRWEECAFELGGGTYAAPAQLVGDFLAGRPSTAFGSVLPSYQPGVRLGDLSSSLPEYAIEAIREALSAFERQIRGFAMPDAVLTGVETRTSSPKVAEAVALSIVGAA
jgi:uncharacterized FAD-dependent dehydrogenase